jgi:prepilin-type N-terminal cleavage/methylation domain-containing protein
MRRSDGVTLIELMIAISIIGIMMAIATPSVLQMRQSAQFRQAAADIASALREARARTATANLEHRVVFLAPNQYTITQGNRSSNSTAWITIPGWVPTNTPQGVTVVPDAGCNAGPPVNVDFNTNGTAGVPGLLPTGLCTISIQNAAAVNQYLITVTPNTGRIRITKV